MLITGPPTSNAGGHRLLPEGSSGLDPEPTGAHDEAENLLLLRAGTRREVIGTSDAPRQSVSHVPISPPRWCLLPYEVARTSRGVPTPSDEAWEHFPLDSTARCCCGTELQHHYPDMAGVTDQTLRRSATIYGFTKSRQVTIDVIPCPFCRHSRRLIGGDLGNFRIFNWNNTFLFTHELLDAYTSAYTASETPFSAFCIMVRRLYMNNGLAEDSFCSDETFVRAWFAFTDIQELDSGMTCSTCGPHPEVIIVDGLSLATQSSKLGSSVRPPTFVDGSSEQIESISTYKARRLPAVPEAPMRATALALLDEISASVTRSTPIPNLGDFATQYEPFARFIHFIGLAKQQGSRHYAAYRSLALQIAAPDIVLQLVPFNAITELDALATCPDVPPPPWLQALCPAVGAVINSHLAERSELPAEFRIVAGWLATRARDVFEQLAQHDAASPVLAGLPQRPWQETGTWYGIPAVRQRRVYTKLQHDAKPSDRDANQMGDCNKFYKTYTKNGLAGGMFVMWCTHSVCLGFHSIPVAEGRNDVFAAIYTRFPVAPKIVIYDFACQLAPYCLVREARYFRHTRFLIDELHAHDHSKCGQACFASNAMRYDDRVRAANTSAAECGNKGMKRIRKSVSFMTHRHALCYTKVFLDIWNRTVIRRMNSVKG